MFTNYLYIYTLHLSKLLSQTIYVSTLTSIKFKKLNIKVCNNNPFLNLFLAMVKKNYAHVYWMCMHTGIKYR